MIVELLRETSLDAYLKYLNRDKKKFTMIRWFMAIILSFMFSVLALLSEDLLLWATVPIAFIAGYKTSYITLILGKNNKKEVLSFLFPQFLQSFMSLMPESGSVNVYQTLQASVRYTSEPLKSELENLIQKIERENKREDYLTFAEYVGTNEAYMVMGMIYQFSEFGVKKEALNELRAYIRNLQENKMDELIEKKVLSAEKYAPIPIIISLFLSVGYFVAIFWYYMRDITDLLGSIF